MDGWKKKTEKNNKRKWKTVSNTSAYFMFVRFFVFSAIFCLFVCFALLLFSNQWKIENRKNSHLCTFVTCSSFYWITKLYCLYCHTISYSPVFVLQFSFLLFVNSNFFFLEGNMKWNEKISGKYLKKCVIMLFAFYFSFILCRPGRTTSKWRPIRSSELNI